jgi:arsenite methyltransferase
VTDTDVWATWLRSGRDGGSAQMRATNLERLASARDRILDRAEIVAGNTVLDVGTGQGLLGLAALERNGPAGHVIFSDVSEPSLADCRAEVAVDVLVERAVLLFIQDRARAFAEYHRVLRPGGRLSIAEPLNSWMGVDRPGYLWGYDVTEVIDLERKIHAADQENGGTADDELLRGFDDRDLVAMARAAGFLRVEALSERSLAPPPVREDVDVFLDTAPNPLAPTTRALMDIALSPEEARRFTSVLRDALREGRGERRHAMAYLRAWS